MDRVDPVVYCRPGYFADQRRGVDRFEKNGMKIYRAPATIYFGEEPPALPAPARRRFHARCNGNGGTAVVLADGETVRRPTRRKRPVVRRPWMGVELSAAMDAAGMSDATVRWLVTRHIYEQELAGKAGREGGV